MNSESIAGVGRFVTILPRISGRDANDAARLQRRKRCRVACQKCWWAGRLRVCLPVVAHHWRRWKVDPPWVLSLRARD